MELVSLGRQSVYPRIYLASYRGTSLAMETAIAQRTRSGACSYWNTSWFTAITADMTNTMLGG